MLNAQANQNRIKQIWHYARNKDILFTLFCQRFKPLSSSLLKSTALFKQETYIPKGVCLTSTSKKLIQILKYLWLSIS